MSNYINYFFNSNNGGLYSNLFCYTDNINKNNIYNDIKNNLKSDIIHSKYNDNKILNIKNTDIHFEFTDFIINVALWHKSFDKTNEHFNYIKKIRSFIISICDPIVKNIKIIGETQIPDKYDNYLKKIIYHYLN